jgi:hypothetical protein
MLDSITAALTSTDTSTIPTMSGALAAMCISLLFGLVISLCYLKTNRNMSSPHSFAVTLVMLPVILTIIIMFVGNDIARAFSLAGTMSIIRFRSAPGEPKDIGFIFFALASGLSCGVGMYLYGAVFTAFLSAAMIVLDKIRYGQRKNIPQTLKITIPEDLNYRDAFSDILDTYTQKYFLHRVKTTDLGSLFEVNYQVVLNSDTSEKEFLDALRCRNGNLRITLTMALNE